MNPLNQFKTGIGHRGFRGWARMAAGLIRVNPFHPWSLLLGLGILPALHATDATSETRVALVQSIAPATVAGPQATYLSVPLAGAVLAGGTLTSIDGAVLGDTAATWSTGQFDPAAGAGGDTHLLELTSGPAAGWWSRIEETLTTPQPALHLAEAPPAGVSPGNSYRVRRFARLATVLGDGAGLAAGSDPSGADQLLLIDPATQGWRTFFRSSFPGYEGWWTADFEPAGGQLFAPGQGLIVRRIAASATTVALTGVARDTPLRVRLAPGYNLAGTGRLRTGLTLAASGLHTGSEVTGLRGGANATAADNVIVPQPGGGFAIYFYSTVAGYTGWFNQAYQPAGSVELPPAAGFVIHRKGATGFDWVVPAE